MSVPSGQPTSVGTDAEDYGESYYRSHCGSDQPQSWDSPTWREFFRAAAERIRAITNPNSVLDVGCARGLLVQAFCEQGVDAYGIDVSQHAVETAHADVASRLSVRSAEEVAGSWDLITCIEVLEHMAPAAAERAIESMCAASDRILMSSTPSDFSEPTHINVREPAAWAASFAERSFFRRTDVDLAFVAPWTVLFERADLTQRDVVYRYERYSYPMRVEVLEKRAALRDAHRRLTEHRLDEILELRHQLLTSRDHAIGAEAEAAQWRLRCEQAYGSRTWRLSRALVGPVSRLRQRLR